jgi:hypothetical protein
MSIEDQALAVKDLDLQFGYHYEDIIAGKSSICFMSLTAGINLWKQRHQVQEKKQ